MYLTHILWLSFDSDLLHSRVPLLPILASTTAIFFLFRLFSHHLLPFFPLDPRFTLLAHKADPMRLSDFVA